MELGKGWSSGREHCRRRGLGWLGPALCLLTGCALGRPHLDEALLARPVDPTRTREAAAHYLVACPDVLEVTITGRPEGSGRHAITADGRLDLGPLGRFRVEGRPAAAVAGHIATEAGLPPGDVQVRVAEHNSQQVYLVGAVTGLQHAVPYEGPETVLDLLQRTGGIAPGAAPGEVHVIRPGVAEGRPPQVFHIDLQAIVLDHDERSNLQLQPFDQVFVGESRRSSFARCIPPCLRGPYDCVCGLCR
jgi:protein involved in polysaccharide export with SLBB domain